MVRNLWAPHNFSKTTALLHTFLHSSNIWSSTGLSLCFKSPATLFSRPVANRWILSTTGNFICNIKGKFMLSHNIRYGLWPFLTALCHYIHLSYKFKSACTKLINMGCIRGYAPFNWAQFAQATLHSYSSWCLQSSKSLVITEASVSMNESLIRLSIGYHMNIKDLCYDWYLKMIWKLHEPLIWKDFHISRVV